MTEKSIALAVDFLTSRLNQNSEIVAFSALNASDYLTNLYSIYNVLAQGCLTPGVGGDRIKGVKGGEPATEIQATRSSRDSRQEAGNKVKLPSLDVVEQSLIQYLELNSPASSSAKNGVSATISDNTERNEDLEWAIVGLAAISVYAHTVETLKDQTLPLSQDILYWDSVLYGNHETLNILIYHLQQLPTQLWNLLQHYRKSGASTADISSFNVNNFDARKLVNSAIKSLGNSVKVAKRVNRQLRKTVSSPLQVFLFLFSPLIKTRQAIRYKRTQVQVLRNSSALVLGHLVDAQTLVTANETKDWTAQIVENIDKINAVVQRDLDTAESIIADETASSGEDETISARGVTKLNSVKSAERLLQVIQKVLPQRSSRYAQLTTTYGKPTARTRYWPAAVGLGLAASFGTRAVIGNWSSICEWAQTRVLDTAIAFYNNWIVSPLTKIYQTIRHDENGQVALMTKQSLEADMRSLERMVIAFAKTVGRQSGDHAGNISEEMIRNSVQQGDISSVLIPYEQQIQTPFKSIVAGQLVQALLIQVQKTKVDVETAVSGIDKILKSQELVFGVVAALPSVLISGWLFKGIFGLLFGGGNRAARRTVVILDTVASKESFVSVLGNVDRLLLQLTNTSETRDEIYYQTLGLFICESGLLKDIGSTLLSTRTSTQARGSLTSLNRNWETDIADLQDISIGTQNQRLVLDRIYNIYVNILFN